jgi:carbamoyltransferase
LIIVGISAAHDANVCVLRDGDLLLHVEKERLTRVRYDGGSLEAQLPSLLATIGLSMDEVDAVATSTPVWAGMPTTGVTKGGDYHHSTGWGQGSIELCGRSLPAWKIAHHLGHVAYAYYTSPFEEADIMSVDGGGNFTFGLLCHGRGNHIEAIADLNDQNVAWLWDNLSATLFGTMDGAGKVMGLASYGSDHYAEAIRSAYGRPGKLGYRSIFVPEFPDHLRPIPFLSLAPLESPLKSASSSEADMAASLQAVTTELLLDILRTSRELRRSEDLCLSGGVALNCVANEAIRRSGLCKRVFVGPAPNDSGLSIGFATYLWHNILGNPRSSCAAHSPYQGPPHASSDLATAVDRARQDAGLRISAGLSPEARSEAVADCLARQKIVGIHVGRAESGPRALGARSILSDPRDASMKDKINSRVKFREAFRPFAPAVLAERANEYFDFGGDSPYMSFAPRARALGAATMPATVHVDGTARLQTVDELHHPAFRRLIDEFYKRTGVPGVLNTSLNTRGEPLCETPLDSLITLQQSGLDALMLEDFFIEKVDP